METGNVLWVMTRRGDLDESAFVEASGLLAEAPLLVRTPMQSLLPSAARLARELDHPVYDCAYLALAINSQYPVVTADLKF